jgi:glycosyltransferase involved in cell wall biosynthesis
MTPPVADGATEDQRSPRLLVVGSFPASAPLERYPSGDLAVRLASRGWRIITTSREEGRLGRLWEMVGSVVRDRGRYEVAVVDVFSGRAFLWAEAVVLALRALGKPFVLVLHGGNLPEFARLWPGRVRRLLDGAAAVTSPSAYLAKQLERFRGDIRCLPNAIEVSRFVPRASEKMGCELVWLRAFHEIYNPMLAPAVLACLIGEFPGMRLTMIGPDKGDGSLERTRRAAANLGVSGACHFVGRVEKSAVPAWLAKGDIFLNTTNVDNAPVSVTEAQAASLCVVSTSVGGIPYLLENENDALLVPPCDARAMAEAVRRLIVEPGLAANLSRNGRLKAEKFDWSYIVPEWESLIRDAAKGHL